jgi:hypothetical protein
MSDVHLISLDFDGTIMVYDEPPGFFHPEVIDALNALEARGVAWCTNSGRDRADQERVLAACYARGLRHRPVALLCSESVIFEQQGSAYHPAEPWNSNVHARLVTLQRQVQALLEPELEGMHRWHRGFVTYPSTSRPSLCRITMMRRRGCTMSCWSGWRGWTSAC